MKDLSLMKDLHFSLQSTPDLGSSYEFVLIFLYFS